MAASGRPLGGLWAAFVVDALLQITRQRLKKEQLSVNLAGSSFLYVNLRYLNLANGWPGLAKLLSKDVSTGKPGKVSK